MLSYMHTSINELNVAKRENDFNCQLSVGWSFQWFLHIFIRSCVHHCIVYLGRFFFLRFMTFDFGWVCLRKSENIMSDACCLVLLFFLLFHRFGSCECVWCWQAFCYFVNFQFAEMIFLLIFFRCLSWQLFTFPLLFALASITTLQTLNTLLIRWRRCCSLLCEFITFKLCLMLFFPFVERSNQFVSTENFIKTRDAVVQYYWNVSIE